MFFPLSSSSPSPLGRKAKVKMLQTVILRCTYNLHSIHYTSITLPRMNTLVSTSMNEKMSKLKNEQFWMKNKRWAGNIYIYIYSWRLQKKKKEWANSFWQSSFKLPTDTCQVYMRCNHKKKIKKQTLFLKLTLRYHIPTHFLLLKRYWRARKMHVLSKLL